MAVRCLSASSQYINLGNSLAVTNGVGVMLMEALIRCVGSGLMVVGSYSIGGTPPQGNVRAAIYVQAGTFRALGRAPDGGSNQLVNSGITVNDGAWHYVAAAISYATNVIYYDVDGTTGSGAVTFGAASTTASNSANGAIGALANGSNYHFNGDIADFRATPDWLRGIEVTDTIIFARGLDGVRRDLAHRYMLDELAPGVVVPSSGSPIRDQGYLRRDGNGVNSPTYIEAPRASVRMPACV